MNIVNLDRVSKGYGPGAELLVDTSLGLDEADRVGVVGLNGAGKTTLLRLVTKAEEPDAGRVTHRRDLRVAALPQVLELPPEATVRQLVLGTAAEHEWAGDAAVRAVLGGLSSPGYAFRPQDQGMPGLGLDTPVGTMSGGERRRVALAALLVRSSDLLVLDEPTNHLDVAGIDWLAGFLAGRRGALVVVTHDRWFLDAVCDRMWEVADSTVRSYEGGFAAWTLARAERERLSAAAEARRQNLLRKEIAWLRRGPPARTSKPKFRIEAAQTLIADVPPPRDPVALRRLATARLGKQVYELDDVVVHLGSLAVLDGLTWRVGPGDRIGVVGANGAGKTTLLRVLAGTRTPDAGRVATGATVRVALLSQELAELPTGLRVLEAVEQSLSGGRHSPDKAVSGRIRIGDRELSAAQVAEVFGFPERRLWTVVGELSGGEQRRLQILRLLAGEPNVLLLDEPTNDLDTDTLAALEDLLDSWPGTLIVASHDRYLVERVTDMVYGMFGDGRLTHLPGGVDEYIARLYSDDHERVSRPASVSREKAHDRRSVARELARLERQLTRLGEQEARLHGEQAEHATDYERLSTLDAELRAVRDERERLEEQWLTLAEQVPAD